MDTHWLNCLEVLENHDRSGQTIVGPAEMSSHLSSLTAYSGTAELDADQFDVVAIHKGLYEEIDPSFLAKFMTRSCPVYADPVFIVLASDGERLSARNPHLGAIRDIQRWLVETLGPESAGDGIAPTMSGEAAFDRMVKFIVKHLIKPIDAHTPHSPLAVAETAERFNDSAWFWVDDSGKAAELFAAPRVRDAYPELADALLDHVLRLSADKIMHRRSAVPELRVVDKSPQAFSAYNCFFRLTGDLVSGAVRPAIRFNDDRTRFLGEFAGHSLEFTYGSRPHVIDVESCITSWNVEENDASCTFSHSSTIRARGLVGATRAVAELTYTYTFFRDKPTIALQVDLKTAADARLDSVRLSTAIDQLASGGNFGELRIGVGDDYRLHAVPIEPRADLHKGPADYLGINEANFSPLSESAGIPGFAHGFHIAFRNPKQIERIAAVGSREGRFHWVRIFYSLGRLERGQTHTIREDRLMTGGGYYSEPAIYRALLDMPLSSVEAMDPAMSYDIGAELNAVAVTLLFAQQGRYRSCPDMVRQTKLRVWFDNHLNIYRRSLDRYGDQAHAHVFLRGIAFVILALDAMARAYPEGEYHLQLAHFVNILKLCESNVADAHEESVYSGQLDCHCAAILAFARASASLPDDRELLSTIRRALRAIKAGSVPGEVFGHPGTAFNSLYICTRAGHRAEDAGFWVFKLGLALRAFNAVSQAQAAGFLKLDEETTSHMNQLAAAARDALGDAARPDGAELEILTSYKSGETNSETQPWVALGIAPVIEWEIFGRPETLPELPVIASNSMPSVPLFPEFNRMAPPIKIDWECTPEQANALTDRVSQTWEELGRDRPHWSVMSNDQFLPELIGQSEGEFFDSGNADRDRLIATLERCGRSPAQFDTVVEFGCGLGRITNHLAERFNNVIGCDISQPHLDLAMRNSLRFGKKNIDYKLARMPDFGMVTPFDLWFSVIVLQHNPPPIMAAILGQTFKMLRPGGLAVFQLPTYAATYKFALVDYLSMPRHENSFEMHCLPQHAVFGIAADAGCRVIEVTEDHVVGDPSWLSNVIVIGKPS